MGPIQSGINQSLAILSLASSQSPEAQAQRKATADTKAFDKFVKTDKKTPFALGDKSEKMFNQLKQNAIRSNLKAGRTKGLSDINTAKPESQNIKDDIKSLAKDYGLEEGSAEQVTDKIFKNIKDLEDPSISSQAVRGKVQEALKDLKDDKELNAMRDSLTKRYSANKGIKYRMKMMKTDLKGDD